MVGRRSHPRFALAAPWDGAMRVLKEVVVQRTDANALLAVSHSPGIVGEEMTLDVLGAGARVRLRVNVVESRPVILEGSVRHRLRLGVLDAGSEAAVAGDSHAVSMAGEPEVAEAQ